MDNLRRLDKCTEEFTAKVQEMMNALSEYWTVRNAELQGVREELVNSIDKAVKEVSVCRTSVPVSDVTTWNVVRMSKR